MRRIFVFNGDADGLCALQQLRLADPAEPAQLVTGAKRDTGLVGRAVAGRGDLVTVLDLSLAANRGAVLRLLEAGARVRYFDHHDAGDLPAHPAFEPHIERSPELCTSAIVDRYLQGTQRVWAVVGAYGDNLEETAIALAGTLGVEGERQETLRQLGVALNYNSYGETVRDLLFHPLALHERLMRYADPFEFVAGDPAFRSLIAGYEADLQRALEVPPAAASARAALYRLPEAAWARRVNGVFANRLARAEPRRAHAVLLPKSNGCYTVSVRAPLARPYGASALCRAYAGGGGREGAAGISDLPAAEADRFARHFMAHFGR